MFTAAGQSHVTGGILVSHPGSGRLPRYAYLILVILVLCSGLLACRSSLPEATPASSPVESPGVGQASSAPTVLPAATELVVATSTPAPSSAQVVLLALPGSDAAKTAELEATLTGLAAQDGLTFEVMTELNDLQLAPETRLVVTLPPDPGVANLAAANPQVQFLVLGIPGVAVTSNLSQIGSDGERPDQQGFLAGYLAAVLTPDWRVGVISQSASPAGKAAQNGFTNGVIFYCGLCRPSYPPFIQYPIQVDLAAVADPQAAVDSLVSNAVKTVYVSPAANDQALLDSLAQAGLQIIASGAPQPQIASQWVAGISMDEMGAVRQVWPRLLAGEGGLNLSTPLALVERNPALFSPGRQRLVDKMLTDLLAGYVDSGVDPQTGEMR
jgi:hypothetical protein